MVLCRFRIRVVVHNVLWRLFTHVISHINYLATNLKWAQQVRNIYLKRKSKKIWNSCITDERLQATHLPYTHICLIVILNNIRMDLPTSQLCLKHKNKISTDDLCFFVIAQLYDLRPAIQSTAVRCMFQMGSTGVAVILLAVLVTCVWSVPARRGPGPMPSRPKMNGGGNVGLVDTSSKCS